jgi:tetratricopeptide (TPR) repeat protein
VSDSAGSAQHDEAPDEELTGNEAEIEARLLRVARTRQQALRVTLEELATFYQNTERVEDWERCLDRTVDLHEEANHQSGLLVMLGVTAERREDWDMAIRYYARSLSANPTDPDLAYFSHNNLGYCLNQLGDWEPAESYCRSALHVNPTRHNAHKNLGLSLCGQGRYLEAAHSFIVATERQPRDVRALAHLDDMIREHPDAFHGSPDLLARARELSQREPLPNGQSTG